nr:hypothetical protein [Bacteroidota bacterium]
MHTKQVLVNPVQCERVAAVIKPLKLRWDFYRREYLTAKLDEETNLDMHFYAVAICHQTHSLHNPALNIFGWDYLEYGFLILARSDSKLLQPAYLADAAPGEIAKMLQQCFSHTGIAEGSTLDRIAERVHLMIDASQYICKHFNGSIQKMIQSSGNRLLGDGTGMYEILSNIEAFSDPYRKKSTFFLKLAVEAGLLQIEDPENIIPIMDYHMQRVLLRLGCISIIDNDLEGKIINRVPLDSDVPIRDACIEAFRIIADKSGHQVMKMNDFFWSLGRSCCGETTLCRDHSCTKVPCTLVQIVAISDHSTCIFDQVCFAKGDNKYMKLWQPVVDTHYY